jgi:KaiC/GvpD/RAD55 family RecA-like ATPase
MNSTPNNLSDSGDKLDLLLKKVAVLEDMVLLGNKVYMKKHAEKIPRALLQGKVTTAKSEVLAGEIFIMEIEIINFGRSPSTLDGIEEILPCCGLEMMTAPKGHSLEDFYLDLNGKVLEPSKKEKLRFSVRALEKGTHVIGPRVVYVAEEGGLTILNLEPVTIQVKEVLLPDRLSTGYKALDNLLFGGIPFQHSVAMTSISCDETKLLIDRFIEKGTKDGETTFIITMETGRWEKLAKEFPNFNLFLCNPQAETTSETPPNIFKLRGSENLTDINIPLVSTLRKLRAPNDKPRRICIENLSDILLQHKAVQTRRWLTGLIADLKFKGFTTLALINPYMHPAEEVQAVLDLFDGEMEVYEEDQQKFLRIKKMYGQDYIGNELPLRKGTLSMTGIARRLRYRNY